MTIASSTDPTMDPDGTPVAPPLVNLPPPTQGKRVGAIGLSVYPNCEGLAPLMIPLAL